MNLFGRLLTAMVTPMKADGSVDYDQAAQLAIRLVESGSDGVVVAGTTGESPTLTDEEKLSVFRVVTDAIGGRASVLAGTGSNSTDHSIHLTRSAEKAGVDGIMAVVPYYNRPPQEGLYRHFKAIAEATSLPIMLYNVPSRTAQNMLPETVLRLSEIPNVVSLKEASGSLDQTTQLKRLLPDAFLIYSGDDSLTLPMMAVGAAGVVSVAAHIVGRRMKEMIGAFVKGDVETAQKAHLELFPIFKGLFLTTSPIPVKKALSLLGVPVGPLRLPLCDPSDKELQEIKTALADAGLL